jgi:hypothetical protein
MSIDVYIIDIEWDVFTKRQLLPIKLLFGALVASCHLSQRPSFVTGGAWSEDS